MKTCTRCELEKELSDFPIDRRKKSGYNSRCKVCINLVNKEYRDTHKESFNQSRKKYYQKHIDKMRKARKKYCESHREKKAIYDKTYRQLNIDILKQYKKDWEEHNKDNPIFKIKKNLRRRVHHALKGNYKADRTFNLIGCTPEFFKSHIESQFTEGMNWSNYGEWHIDHIRPCCTFDLTDENQQRECFHYSNQRPLWAVDNLKRPKNI